MAGAVFVAALLTGKSWREREAPRAVLFDEVSLFDPRADFRLSATRMLESAGFDLTVVPAEDVTVGRLKDLPSHRASIIILRTHSALVEGDRAPSDDVALFTSEPVDSGAYGNADRSSAPAELKSDGHSVLTRAELSTLISVRRTVGEDRRPYVGVGPDFVREHLRGRFRSDAVVILMGCDTLRGHGLSDAFLARGARAVIGWSDPVSAAHTDAATITLVRDLLAGATVPAALRRAMSEVGPDPRSGAVLIADVRDEDADSAIERALDGPGDGPPAAVRINESVPSFHYPSSSGGS